MTDHAPDGPELTDGQLDALLRAAHDNLLSHVRATSSPARDVARFPAGRGTARKTCVNDPEGSLSGGQTLVISKTAESAELVDDPGTGVPAGADSELAALLRTLDRYFGDDHHGPTARPEFRAHLAGNLERALSAMFAADNSGSSLGATTDQALPGDELYPIKLFWEKLRIVMNVSDRGREWQYLVQATTRLHEIQSLLRRRDADVDGSKNSALISGALDSMYESVAATGRYQRKHLAALSRQVQSLERRVAPESRGRAQRLLARMNTPTERSSNAARGATAGMQNHATRLARLLETHPDVVHVEGATETLIKKDELLVLGAHADAVHESARRWVEVREDFAELGVTRLRLRSGAGVAATELVHDLRSGAGAHRRASVTPNHVLCAGADLLAKTHGTPVPLAQMPTPSAGFGAGLRIVVGILDTGILPHPWFTGSAWYESCAPDHHELPDPAAGRGPDSVAGHGTFAAGIVLQQAPNAFLRVERVLGGDGIADELELLHGLARIRTRTAADADRLDILTLPLGCFTFDDRPSPVLAEAVARLSRHTLVVAAAGDNGQDRPFWPAALKQVVAVAALARQGGADGPEPASFSNYGWWVDAVAPGEHVASSFLSHRRAHGEDFDGYATWSGTGFAASHVAGRIAALMSDKAITAREAAGELLDPGGNPILDVGIVVSADSP
ncbi:MAG: S8/S53 family peptidase [Catenulispora sp.]|nr:S8/S53 family peptidase [Catenulispora sp.]